MKVLEKGTMQDGTKIQIEDWKEDYSHVKTLNVATYPIAANTSESGFIERNKTFRLDINSFNNDNEVLKAFKDLLSGNKTISDFADQFYNGDKDKYLYGMI